MSALAEVSPRGLLSLVQALQGTLEREASAVCLLAHHPQLAPSLVQLLQPQSLAALRSATVTQDVCWGRTQGLSLPYAITAAAASALFAPFTHVHATAQAESALTQLQQTLAANSAVVPSLLSCLRAAPVTDGSEGGAKGGWQDEAPAQGSTAVLLVPAVGLLARVVMATNRTMAQFVSAGGVAPDMVDR